jgi:hypothetical protein
MAVIFAAMSFISERGERKSKGTVMLHFQNYIGKDLLKLDSETYKNAMSQPYSVSKFKYYISNIHLKRNDGFEYISSEYFLVNQEKEVSEKILLHGVEQGEYTAISFTLGVDSLRNCSGIQSGALDPMLGMFWAWNTGYIFLKIEGHSPVSKSPGNIFEFHVGGFREPTNAVRNIELPFKDDALKVSEGNNSVIKIKTDAGEIFKNPVTIDFSKLSSVTDFNNATMMADNYADMFSIIEIK